MCLAETEGSGRVVLVLEAADVLCVDSAVQMTKGVFFFLRFSTLLYIEMLTAMSSPRTEESRLESMETRSIFTDFVSRKGSVVGGFGILGKLSKVSMGR